MDYFNVTEKDDVEDGFDAAAEVEQIDTPVSRRGEVYQLGRHKLMCGDSTCEEDYQKLLGDEKASLVFTDPPYMVDYHSSSKAKRFSSSNDKVDGSNIYNDNLDDDGAIEFYCKVLERLYEHTTNDAPIYWWYAANKQMLNEIAFKNTGWYHSQNVIWVKAHFVFAMGQDFHRQHEPAMFGWKKGNKHFKARKLNNLSDTFTLSKDEFGNLLDVWIEDRDKQTDYIHPTQKPIALPIRGIRVSSRPGDIVIDAFGGSGSTLMACERMGRRARIMELDPKFCDAIRKRYTRFINGSDEGWETYTPVV